MKHIDAHLHFANYEAFTILAEEAGHQNSAERLRADFERVGALGGVVMGNRDLSLESHNYPDFLHYCICLDSMSFTGKENAASLLQQVEAHLQRERCVGLKLYPGYNAFYVYDAFYTPFYELAASYDKPVAIHTGELAGNMGLVKYSHPLTVDEVAVAHPRTRFVLCHLGNPWLMDAAVVISKNANVSADLSGFLKGRQSMDTFFEANALYVNFIKMALQYMQAWDRLMYGTDWPLANLDNYVDFIARLIPERYHHLVFYENAQRIYKLPY